MEKEEIENILHNVIKDFNNKWSNHEQKFDGISEYADKIIALVPSQPVENAVSDEEIEKLYETEYLNKLKPPMSIWRNKYMMNMFYFVSGYKACRSLPKAPAQEAWDIVQLEAERLEWSLKNFVWILKE